MGYVAEEYKYTSASGLVSENKELVPGDDAFAVPTAVRLFCFSLHVQRSEFHTTCPPSLSPTAAAAPLFSTSLHRSASNWNAKSVNQIRNNPKTACSSARSSVVCSLSWAFSMLLCKFPPLAPERALAYFSTAFHLHHNCAQFCAMCNIAVAPCSSTCAATTACAG